MAVHRCARFPRQRPAASACSITTATACSTFMSFREASSPPIRRGRTRAIGCSETRATARLSTRPNNPASPRMKRGYGHGVTVGDIDNDGHPDLFVTRWRSYALYHNRGDGTFEDITDQAGLGGDRDWPTSAAFADLDNDGDLDLYVCHYLVWDADHPTLCHRKTVTAASERVEPGQMYNYCTPRLFPALPDHLFRNDGGRFVDVTADGRHRRHERTRPGGRRGRPRR